MENGRLRTGRSPKLVVLTGGAALALAAVVTACATAGARFGYELRPGSPVWPQPPEPVRVRYVGAIATPEDIGRTRSVFRRAVELIVGRSEEKVLQPYGIAVDSAGRLYVGDSAARGVHVFDIEQRKYRFEDGDGTPFRFPVGVAVDPAGRLFVADAEAATVTGIDEEGHEFLRIDRGLRRPAGLAFNPANLLLYVVDVLRNEVLAVDLDGELRFAFGGRGTGPGELNFPTNVAVGRHGEIYVTDAMNFRVQVFSAEGAYQRSFGRAGDAVGDMARPKGIGVDSEGHIFVVEGLFDAVNVFDAEGRLLLTFGGPGTGPGQFWLATGLYVDSRNRIWVADSYNGRVQVFQYVDGPAE